MNVFKAFYVMSLATLLASCGDDGFSSTPVSVIAQSGDTVELTGTWKSDCYTDTADRVDVRTYSSDGRLTAYTLNYSTTDASCSADQTTSTIATSVRVFVGTNKTASGWSDGAGGMASSAPDDQTGSPLPDPPIVSRYSMDIDDSSTVKSIDLIDDSVAGSWVMYVADTAADDDTDGYDDYISIANPLNLQ